MRVYVYKVSWKAILCHRIVGLRAAEMHVPLETHCVPWVSSDFCVNESRNCHGSGNPIQAAKQMDSRVCVCMR